MLCVKFRHHILALVLEKPNYKEFMENVVSEIQTPHSIVMLPWLEKANLGGMEQKCRGVKFRHHILLWVPNKANCLGKMIWCVKSRHHYQLQILQNDAEFGRVERIPKVPKVLTQILKDYGTQILLWYRLLMRLFEEHIHTEWCETWRKQWNWQPRHSATGNEYSDSRMNCTDMLCRRFRHNVLSSLKLNLD